MGGLCVIGFLLATYMAGESRTADFWASLIAGVAVLGVVFFPTTRAGLPPGAPACGSTPEPAGCSFVEQTLGEHQTATIHAVCAIVFILFLAVMSFLFATSEVLPETERLMVPGKSKPSLFRRPALFWIHITCTLAHPGRRSLGLRGRRNLAIDPALHRGSRFRLGLRHLLAGGRRST